jgi:hypothetical protein
MDGKSDDLAEFAETVQATEGTTAWAGIQEGAAATLKALKSALIAAPLTGLVRAAPMAHADPDPGAVASYLLALTSRNALSPNMFSGPGHS